MMCPIFIGVFRRGNKPPVLLGEEKSFSNDKNGELDASRHPPWYNDDGLTSQKTEDRK